MSVAIDEGEVWDASRILREYYAKGYLNDNAGTIKELCDGLEVTIKELERTLREDSKSDLLHIQAGIPRLREEIQDLKSKQAILKGRIRYFKQKQRELKDAPERAAQLQERGKMVYAKVLEKLKEIKMLFEEFREIQSEVNRLIAAWEFHNWEWKDKERLDTACSWLTLTDLRELIKRESNSF